MIVKNEAHIIQDTLHNILEYFTIDYWVIADTGSTDTTIQLIETFFQKHNIVGEIHQHEWKNFAYNRQLALDAAAHKTDYVLFFDADDRIEGELNLPIVLQHDAYIFKLYNENMLLPRQLLVKNNQTFYWRGDTHEVITPYQSTAISQIIEGHYKIQVGHFGARSQDPHKYLNDAHNLAMSFEQETNPDLKRRYAYFCGQSFICAKHYLEAEDWLKQHIVLCQAKTEELRYAYIVLGRLYQVMDQQTHKIDAWLKAYEHAPHHGEALGLLAEHYNNVNCHQLAFDFALKASYCADPQINQVIIINDLIHRYGIHYQLAYAAYHLKNHAVLYQAIQPLLHQSELNPALNLFIIEAYLYLFSEYVQREDSSHIEKLVVKFSQLTQLDETGKIKQKRLICALKELIKH